MVDLFDSQLLVEYFNAIIPNDFPPQRRFQKHFPSNPMVLEHTDHIRVFFKCQITGTWDRIWRNHRCCIALRRSYLQHYCSEWFRNWNITQVLSENTFSGILVHGIMSRVAIPYLSLPKFQRNPISDLIDVCHPICMICLIWRGNIVIVVSSHIRSWSISYGW